MVRAEGLPRECEYKRVSDVHVVLRAAAARLCVPLAISPPRLSALSGPCVASPIHLSCAPRASPSACARMPSRAPQAVARTAGFVFALEDGRLAAPVLMTNGGASSSAGVFHDSGGAAMASATRGDSQVIPPGVEPWPSVAPTGASPAVGLAARPRHLRAQALKRPLPHAGVVAPRRRARALPPLARPSAPLRRMCQWRLLIRGRCRMPMSSKR